MARKSRGRRRSVFQKKKSKNGGMFMFLFLLCVMFIGMGASSMQLRHKSEALEERKLELARQIEEQENYTRELEELKKYTKTKKYAEEVAKEKLGLVYSDEIVFRPED